MDFKNRLNNINLDMGLNISGRWAPIKNKFLKYTI